MTKEKFLAYEKIRDSGEYNMMDIKSVIALAEMKSEVELTKDDCMDIMKNYDKYAAEYL